MERVIAGEVLVSVSAICRERSVAQADERSFSVGGTFIDYLGKFKGTGKDFAAGVAAHVLRRWRKREDREWFAVCLEVTAEMIEANLETKVPLLELPRTTVRRLREERPQR